jgi:O-acetyl-ADP-ribose deacetylase (regulator of RNase III)
MTERCVVDGAIHAAAGVRLRYECQCLHGCRTGEAKITRGYKLPAQYVIHTVGPIGENPRALESCYRNCLSLVRKYGIETVAFCGISTGIYGYPLYSASRIALRVVREWLQNDENRKNIKRIVFCTFLENEEKCYYELMPIYFPVTHPTQTLTPTEVSPISLLDTQQEKQNQSPAQYSSKSKANKRKRSEAKWKKQKTMEQKPIQSLKEKPTEQKKEDVSQSTAVGVSSTTSQNKNRNKESEFDTHPQERNETNTPQSQQLDNSVPSATKDQNPTEILSENQNREQSHLPLSQTHSQQSQSQSQGSNLSTVSSTTNAEVSQPVPTETSSSFTQSQTTATATATTTTTQNESKMDKTESVSSPSKESI